MNFSINSKDNKKKGIIGIVLIIVLGVIFLSQFRGEFNNEEVTTNNQHNKPDYTPYLSDIKKSTYNSVATTGVTQKEFISQIPGIQCQSSGKIVQNPPSLIELRCYSSTKNGGHVDFYDIGGDYVEALNRMKSVVANDIKNIEVLSNSPLYDDEKLSLHMSQIHKKYNEWVEENKSQPKNISFLIFELSSISTFNSEHLDEEVLDDELEYAVYPLLDLTTKSLESKTWIREKIIETRKNVLEKGNSIPFEELDFRAEKIVHRKAFNDWEIAITVRKFGWHGYDVPQFANIIIASAGQIDAMIKANDFINRYSSLLGKYKNSGFGRDPVIGVKKASKWNINKEFLSHELGKSSIIIDDLRTHSGNMYESIYELGRRGLSTSYANSREKFPEMVSTDVKGFVFGDWALIRSQLEMIHKKALISSLLFNVDVEDYVSREINKSYASISNQNTVQGLGYELYADQVEAKTNINVNHSEKIKLENALLKLAFNDKHQDVKKIINDVLENNEDLKNTPYWAIKSVPIPLIVEGNHDLEYKTYNWNGGSISSNTTGFYLELVGREQQGNDHTRAGHSANQDITTILGDDWEIFITTWSGSGIKNKIYTVYILRKGQFEELQRVLGSYY